MGNDSHNQTLELFKERMRAKGGSDNPTQDSIAFCFIQLDKLSLENYQLTQKIKIMEIELEAIHKLMGL